MKDKYTVSVKQGSYCKVEYLFTVEQKYTIVRGLSGTGKNSVI